MRIRLLPYLAALSAGMVVLAGVSTIDRAEEQRFRENNRADILHQLSTVRAKLEGALNSRLFLARGLVAYVSNHPEIDQAEFERLAKVLISQQTGIGSVALYRDSIVSHIYPLKGHEAAIGFDPTSIPEEREAIQRAINSRKTVIAGPVNLVEGGVGFINRTPIFLSPPNQLPETGRYWGLAGVIVDRDTIFQEAGLINSGKAEKVEFALRGKDGLGAEGEVFFGNGGIFRKNPVILEIKLPNGYWQVAAIPVGGWQTQAPISYWLRIGGGISAVLTGVLVYIWVRSPDKLRQAVQRATIALKESETKYRELVQNANSIILKVDPEGNITFFNEFAQHFFGYSETEIIGQNIVGTIVPFTDNSGQDLAILMKQILLHPERHKDQENENIRRNGERVWIAWRNKSLFDLDGNFTGLLCIGTDISDRKQAEAKLQESEQKFRTLYEATSDAVMLLDETAFIDCNRATLEMFGCSNKEEFCGKNPADFSPKFQAKGEDSATLAAQKIQIALQLGKCRFEWLHSRLDGSIFPAEVWLTYMELVTEDNHGLPRQVVQAVVRDITKRKQAEEALRASQQMLRLVMDNIPQAIFWKDLNSVYQGCNQRFAEDVGLTDPAAVVGKTEYDICESESQAEFLQEIDRQVMQSNIQVTQYCEFFKFKNGREAWLETSKIPLHDGEGNVVGILVTYEDISERKRTEEALRESENKFRLLFEQSGDAILLLQNDKFIDCNQAAIEMIRASSKEQLLNLHPAQLSPEKQPDGSNSLIKANENNALAISRGNWRFEWIHKRLDGSEFPVEILLTAIPLQTEKVLHVVWRDITERKRAEEGLKASERRLRRQSTALLELATNYKLTCGDLVVAIQAITETAAKTLELERASVWLYKPEKLGIICLDLYERSSDRHSSGIELLSVDYPNYFEALQTERIIAAHDANTDPRTSEFSVNYLTPLGITSMLDAPIRLSGQMIGVICHEHIGNARFWTIEEENFAASLADFVALAMEGAERRRAQQALLKANEELEMRVEERTAALKESNHQLVVEIRERKRSEEALRQAEEKYRKIFENAIEGIFQTSVDGRYLSANPALARLYGYNSPEELMNCIQNVEQQIYVDPQQRTKFIQLIEKQQSVSGFESQVYRRDGNIIWVSENARAVRDEQGKILYYEGIVENITKRKAAEEALRYQQEQTEKLLLNILPQPIAERLRKEESTIADIFKEATVLFADIVGFTELSANIPPVELIEMLNEIFSTFDELTEEHGLEKIKTIGDAYMVVGGLPIPRQDHAHAIAEMALDMKTQIDRFNRQAGQNVQLRVGINTGPVIAGVIGIKKFIYDLWGDTVNTASRMESHGLAGEIQVTTTTYELLRDKYQFQKRGNIPIKGKGEMTTYLLTGRML
ncbi:PAS domain S-box protein [Aerosakkonemataceae cyanobacterium BLCC-F154]|uniref:PAS domain S-box protein n=1 Tax=Floridaenema fluviatile BLCC-F154 TaxID=3153640 RepID=A0ABV4Y5L2_9CYAN